ncbi:ARP2/3 complex, 21 kDa p21-Arc subunit [Patellaria atrata CBS 101060]|uniref:Actin-related protein 2/3 complex subunit 3 n=1 Tax=Patellaria atrata CBS 101060 TaxID=1346257 RepID=A0A9P4VVH2_9PEZI|nr:ARP2/3 complex, 21 kDa p21-Arc subunit [Patellaria atrata CBS 101060]
MPVYHSQVRNEPNQHIIGNFPLRPLRTRTRGPAQTLPPLTDGAPLFKIDPDNGSYDSVDDALRLFRADTLFKNFAIGGSEDRVLIYGILFINELLSHLNPAMSKRDAEKAVMNVALDTNFKLPSDLKPPLNNFFQPPRDRQEAEMLRSYLVQVRQELALRLPEWIYIDGPHDNAKHWLMFRKRPFMGRSP